MQNIDYDKIYNSNSYGQFKCIREIKNNKSKERLIEVEFIKTGTIDIFQNTLGSHALVMLHAIILHMVYGLE